MAILQSIGGIPRGDALDSYPRILPGREYSPLRRDQSRPMAWVYQYHWSQKDMRRIVQDCPLTIHAARENPCRQDWITPPPASPLTKRHPGQQERSVGAVARNAQKYRVQPPLYTPL